MDFRMSVDSKHGHPFSPTASEDFESCDFCGGVWRIEPIPGREHIGRFVANNGDSPIYCPREHRVHGEAPCEADNGQACEEARESDDGLCKHTRHDCNCVFCA